MENINVKVVGINNINYDIFIIISVLINPINSLILSEKEIEKLVKIRSLFQNSNLKKNRVSMSSYFFIRVIIIGVMNN